MDNIALKVEEEEEKEKEKTRKVGGLNRVEWRWRTTRIMRGRRW